MPKFHSKQHEINWRAAMAKRSKGKITKPEQAKPTNGALDIIIKELREERDRAEQRLVELDHAVKVLSGIQPTP